MAVGAIGSAAFGPQLAVCFVGAPAGPSLCLSMAAVADLHVGAAAAAAAEPDALVAAPQAKAAAKRRAKPGHIDLDDRIEAAKRKAAEALAHVRIAKNEMRNEKRRRARLVKKAAGLPNEDLLKIAAFKRAGLYDPRHARMDIPEAGGAAGPAPGAEAAGPAAIADGGHDEDGASAAAASEPTTSSTTASPTSPRAPTADEREAAGSGGEDLEE